jgi:hypothetical protein
MKRFGSLYLYGAKIKRRRGGELRLVRSEEEMYPYVYAMLLSGRGRVLHNISIGGLRPDFVVDGGVWRAVVEVKMYWSNKFREQVERYRELGEVCVALPSDEVWRADTDCVIPVDVKRVWERQPVLRKQAGGESKESKEAEVSEEI